MNKEEKTMKTKDDEKMAKALVEAAPEMYKVLQEILEPCPVKGYLGRYSRRKTYDARNKAREILAKVEGKEAK